ncbi:MAG: hypothetical protein AB7N76_06085 [Planctomycetota bacterium]
MRPCAALLALALLAGAPTRAEEGGAVAPGSGADTEPWADALPELPRIRLELTGRLSRPLRAGARLGRGARGFETAKDAHVPDVPALGLAAELDVQPLEWASVGALYWELDQDGPRRSLHYSGISLDGATFLGGTRLETRVRIRFAELSARYIWRDDGRLRLWFGLGAAWGSFQVQLRGGGLRARGHTQDLFAPSLSYELDARLGRWASLYFTSGIAAAPARFPSIATRFRVGLRWRLSERFELVTGLGVRTGLLGTWQEQIARDATTGHRWGRVRYMTVGLDLGLALRL